MFNMLYNIFLNIFMEFPLCLSLKVDCNRFKKINIVALID